jgi:hypothetical protein
MAEFIFPLRKRPDLSYHKDGNKRFFGADRNGRKHAGCDLIADPGTEILAMADGKVIQGPYPFTDIVFALEVKHANGMVVRYGEIAQRIPPGIRVGTSVSQGQVIAYVGRFRKGGSMLHLEMYAGTEEGSLSGGGEYKRRSDLIDPTDILDSAPLLGTAVLPPDSPEDKDASAKPYRKGRVSALVTSTLKVRGEASTASAVLAKLSPMSICRIVEEIAGSPYPPNCSTKWYKVKLDGQDGFVAADFIEVITPDSKPPQPPRKVKGRVNYP